MYEEQDHEVQHLKMRWRARAISHTKALAILVGGEYQHQRHSGHENCFSNEELFDDLDYFLLLRGYPQKCMSLLASKDGRFGAGGSRPEQSASILLSRPKIGADTVPRRSFPGAHGSQEILPRSIPSLGDSSEERVRVL
jgi:hypothetical protein